MPLSLLACQTLVPPITRHDEKLRYVHHLAQRIDDLVSVSPVDLVVLPELSTIDYSREAFSRLSELAEPLGGPTSEIFGDLAKRHGIHLVFGMPRAEGEAYYISQVVLGPDGTPKGHYDKVHIAQFGASMEKDYFTRGDHLLVFDIGAYRIAPIICYDIRVPELCRTLCTDQGAHLVLHCGAYARDESFYSWHDFVVTRAIENLTYFASLNRAGNFYGSSIFCTPWVDEVNRQTILPREETFHRFDVSLNVLGETRRHYPFLSDRLSDYRDLSVQ